MDGEKKFDKQAYDNAYIRDKKDRLNFLLPKGSKEIIREAADRAGVSASEYVRSAIGEKLGRDGFSMPDG